MHVGELFYEFLSLYFETRLPFALHALQGLIEGSVQRSLDVIYHVWRHGDSFEFHLGTAYFGDDLLLHCQDLLIRFLAELDRFHDGALRHFVGAGLHHHDGVVGAGDDKIQVTLFALRECGVNQELPFDVSHPHRADGAREGRLGDRERDRGANRSKHVQVILSISREDGYDYLDIVAESFREERADWPVRQTAGQDSIGSGPAFTTEEAAGDLADGIVPLFEIDCEREEVDPLARLVADNADGQEHGVSVANCNCTAR